MALDREREVSVLSRGEDGWMDPWRGWGKPNYREVTCDLLGAPAILGRPPRGGRSCPLLSRCADFHPRPSRPSRRPATLHRTPANPARLAPPCPHVPAPAGHQESHRACLPACLSAHCLPTAAGSSLTTPSLDPAALRPRSPSIPYITTRAPTTPIHFARNRIALHRSRAAPLRSRRTREHSRPSSAPTTVATPRGPCSSKSRPATASRVDNRKRKQPTESFRAALSRA
ncbi:hypothetical protein PMIN01_11016 [Paraphaeosphaeria minitans]|uniref:Uncharacterized protein n=1 Tax=Paraphaeosphaeria minitans TaxID=565426 RepID=A0A9P6G8I0_9PLEO|nr:hypothetical protein PMIN01_11016 [Paraphaeosphaeria minitans]